MKKKKQNYKTTFWNKLDNNFKQVVKSLKIKLQIGKKKKISTESRTLKNEKNKAFNEDTNQAGLVKKAFHRLQMRYLFQYRNYSENSHKTKPGTDVTR